MVSSVFCTSVSGDIIGVQLLLRKSEYGEILMIGERVCSRPPAFWIEQDGGRACSLLKLGAALKVAQV